MNSQRENNSTDKEAITYQVTTVQGETVCADATVMITGDSLFHGNIVAMTDDQDEYRTDN